MRLRARSLRLRCMALIVGVSLLAATGAAVAALHGVAALAFACTAALLLSLLVASRLQDVILRPLLEVGPAAVPADAERGGDGIDRLVATFAALVARIEAGDAALHEHRDRLEDEVARRTAQLHTANAELALAKAKAERTARAKSRFLANMSHEIRTPMNAVLGMADLLAETDLTAVQRDYCDTISRSGEALLGLLDDVLDLSKIEAGKMHLVPVPADLLLVIEEAIEEQALPAERKGLELLLRYDPVAPRQVVVDPLRLRQLLRNLLSNAIQFTQEGSVVIDVWARPHPREGALFRVTVRDTGIGIAEENRERIFEKFTLDDTLVARRPAGTGGGKGLGLTISRELVALMGGTMGLESRVGQGSTFWFELALPVLLAARSDAAAARLRGRRALVVAPGEPSRRLLGELLESGGVRVGFAASGGEAFDALCAARDAGEAFGFALVDQQLADGSAERLSRAVRANRGLSSLTLLQLLPLTGAGEIDRARASGFDGFVAKPVRPSQFLTLLARALPGLPPGGGDRSGAVGDEEEETPQKPLGARVLLAEDNPVNQKVLGLLLETLGCKVDLAEDGAAAVGRATEVDYDLVFMDCQMPRLDGYDATRAIRRLDGERQRGRTPVIALTAHALSSNRTKCFEAGMDDFLTKPVSLDRLRVALVKWFASDWEGCTERSHSIG
ncbi:MAG TPA: response regulator [Thermoanaerobaculia bacterium]|nr:response regulator [Thermoanaerobaculia bacterium]